MKLLRRPWVSLAPVLLFTNCVLLAAPAAGQTTSAVIPYRFLPRHSVLTETGGIFPREVDYRVFGTFDWVESRPGPAAASLPVVKFDDVNAWASHPILAFVLDLDRVLGMSNLTGRQLPVAAPFDVYQFTGKAQDGSSVDLLASVIGPWLRLRGHTTPPPGGADMFEYSLNAVARRTPFADFNESAHVDAADVTNWSGGFGSTVPGPLAANYGDADDDARIDGADFLAWQRQLGEAGPPLAALDAALAAAVAALHPAATSVPEPAAILLAVAASLMLAPRRRARRAMRAESSVYS